MPRLPRLNFPNIPQHIVQRGNNRQAIFFHEEDYRTYLDYLREALVKNDCKLYAFVLMTNHVHLLASGETSAGISALMQSLGRRYVRHVNTSHQRSGTLFEGRFKSSLVDSERYLLTCMRYIELNPLRAGIVADPGDYRWSSYSHHVGESVIDWLSEPEEFRHLAANAEARAMAYRQLVQQALTSNELETIRLHLNKDCALGPGQFQDRIAAMAGRRAKVVAQGRPRMRQEGQ